MFVLYYIFYLGLNEGQSVFAEETGTTNCQFLVACGLYFKLFCDQTSSASIFFITSNLINAMCLFVLII